MRRRTPCSGFARGLQSTEAEMRMGSMTKNLSDKACPSRLLKNAHNAR